MSIKLILLVFAIIIPSIGEIKEEYRTKWLRMMTILCIVAAAIIQYVQDQAEKDERLAQYRETIKNGNTTITNLDKAYSSIQDIQCDMTRQLDRLKGISGDINEINYPLFPMSMYIIFELPFKSKEAKGLKDYLYDLKEKYDKDKEFDQELVLTTRDKKTDTLVGLNFVEAHRILPKYMGHYYSSFNISIANTGKAGLHQMAHATPQMDFTIGEPNDKYQDDLIAFYANFKTQRLIFYCVFNDREFERESFSQDMLTNKMMNMDDLNGCDFLIYGNKDYKVKYVSFSGQHHIQDCAFQFNKNDVFRKRDTTKMDDLLVTQFHHITAVDFNNPERSRQLWHANTKF